MKLRRHFGCYSAMGVFRVWMSALLALTGCSSQQTTGGISISALQAADCRGATDRLIWHFIATASDGSQLPGGTALAGAVRLSVDGKPARPFYVGPYGDYSRPRLALILLDVSGSMAGQPFLTARAAVSKFLTDFNPALDRVAIAPFGSRDVAATIHSARFSASADDAARALAALAQPRSENNTALYSAVDDGLQTLEDARSRATGDWQLLLIVLTDGKNDLSGADVARDPTLLNGRQGLETVLTRLRTSPVQTFTIGFGRRDQVNEEDLRLLGRGETRIVQRASELETVFRDARQIATNSALIAFARPGEKLPSGRDMPVEISLALPGRSLTGSATWRAPQLSPGVAESVCNDEEKRAAVHNLDLSGNNELISSLVIFSTLGIILAILWYAVPQLIWGSSRSDAYKPVEPRGKGSPSARPRLRGPDDPTEAAPRDQSRYRS